LRTLSNKELTKRAKLKYKIEIDLHGNEAGDLAAASPLKARRAILSPLPSFYWEFFIGCEGFNTSPFRAGLLILTKF